MKRYRIFYTDGSEQVFEAEDLQKFLWIFRMEGDHAVTWKEERPAQGGPNPPEKSPA